MDILHRCCHDCSTGSGKPPSKWRFHQAAHQRKEVKGMMWSNLSSSMNGILLLCRLGKIINRDKVRMEGFPKYLRVMQNGSKQSEIEVGSWSHKCHLAGQKIHVNCLVSCFVVLVCKFTMDNVNIKQTKSGRMTKIKYKLYLCHSFTFCLLYVDTG